MNEFFTLFGIASNDLIRRTHQLDLNSRQKQRKWEFINATVKFASIYCIWGTASIEEYVHEKRSITVRNITYFYVHVHYLSNTFIAQPIHVASRSTSFSLNIWIPSHILRTTLLFMWRIDTRKKQFNRRLSPASSAAWGWVNGEVFGWRQHCWKLRLPMGWPSLHFLSVPSWTAQELCIHVDFPTTELSFVPVYLGPH